MNVISHRTKLSAEREQSPWRGCRSSESGGGGKHTDRRTDTHTILQYYSVSREGEIPETSKGEKGLRREGGQRGKLGRDRQPHTCSTQPSQLSNNTTRDSVHPHGGEGGDVCLLSLITKVTKLFVLRADNFRQFRKRLCSTF